MNPSDVKMLIDQLIKTGEILATKAFELALRQVYVEIAQNFLVVIVCIIVTLVGVKIFRKAQEADYGDFWYGAEPGVVICWTLSVLGFIASMSNIISRLINPEWYAVKILLSTFLGQ